MDDSLSFFFSLLVFLLSNPDDEMVSDGWFICFLGLNGYLVLGLDFSWVECQSVFKYLLGFLASGHSHPAEFLFV